MRIQKKLRFIAATDKKVYFSEGSNLSPDSAWIEMPLAHALTHGLDDGSLSLFKKNRTKILLIVPDHWFKHEFFLFKSQRDSLIRPFLERKLKTTYPSLPSVHHFFSYTCRQKAAEGPGVKVFHLHEQNAYSLYDALNKADLTPRWITTPALLWEERLKLQVPQFSSQAALFVRLHDHEAFLYFFFQGDFLFSRTVGLLEASERWDALLFEINQSIYLFSQKAKSDLNKIYLIEDEANFQERLSEMLGRPVQSLAGDGEPAIVSKELAFLEGLLAQDGVSPPDDLHSITHRRVQQELRWRPIQSTGIAIATVLLLIFLGMHLWLDRQLQDELRVQANMVQQQSVALADYESALDEVAEYAKRPSSAQTIFKAASSLPEAVLINEIKINLDTSSLDLAATVNAENMERFRHTLKSLIENVNRRLRLHPPISIEDIIFHIEDIRNQTGKAQYKIACKVKLP